MGNSLVVKHRITLDLSHRGAQVTVPVTKADTLSQQIIITLRNGTEPVELPDGTRAAIAIHNGADGTGVLDSCIVDHVNNAVVYTFAVDALSVAGNIACDITVFDKEGASLGTPRFNLFVDETGADETAEQLTEALKANGSSWQLVRDVYVKADEAANSADLARQHEVYARVYSDSAASSYKSARAAADEAKDEVNKVKDIPQRVNDIDRRLGGIAELAQGKAKTYVAEKLTELFERLRVVLRGNDNPLAPRDAYEVEHPYWEMGGERTRLHTGDVILIASRDTPDYWFYEKENKFFLLRLENRIPAENYVEKVTDVALEKRVYAVDDIGTQIMLEASQKPSGNSLALRNDGRMAVAAPRGNDDSVPLGYADARYTSKAEAQNIREVAEGKTKSFTVTSLADIGTIFRIDCSTVADEYTITSRRIEYNGILYDLKNGDVFLIVDTEVPDYWVSIDNMKIYKLETTKVDLTGYLKKDDSKSTRKKVYAKNEDGSQTLLECSTGRGPDTIALRDISGHLTSSDPTTDIQCVPLGFADRRYGLRNETRALQAARPYNVSISDIEHQVVEGDRSPVSSGALFNALADAKMVINGQRLAAGGTAVIKQTAYGEYEVYGDGATVSYNGNTFSGRLHQIMLYTTKLSDGSTDTRYRHVSVGSSLLSGYNVEYGTLSTDINIVANELSFFTSKKAISGVEQVPVTTPELAYSLSKDGTYYTLTGVSSTPTDTDIVIASHIDGIPVTTIENRALISIEDMTSLVIPNTVTTIKEYGLALGAPKLAYLKIPHSITTLEQHAICSPYTKHIDFLANVSVIPRSCFQGNNAICDFTIPEGVTEIGISAFENCLKLTAIRFPKSIQTLGWTLFRFCNNLKDIYVPWSDGEVANAPWGATNATIHYNSEV